MPDFNSELAPQVNMVNLPLLKIRAKKVIAPMSPQCMAFTNKKGTFQLARSDMNFYFVTKIRLLLRGSKEGALKSMMP